MSIKAVCVVGPNGKPCEGGSNSGVTGTINFSQADASSPTHITYEVTGLTPGLHGFHVHEKADFSDGCMSAGPHYNPFGKTHGGPDDEERHVGDLGNIEADASGLAKGSMTAPLIHLYVFIYFSIVSAQLFYQNTQINRRLATPKLTRSLTLYFSIPSILLHSPSFPILPHPSPPFLTPQAGRVHRHRSLGHGPRGRRRLRQGRPRAVIHHWQRRRTRGVRGDQAGVTV